MIKPTILDVMRTVQTAITNTVQPEMTSVEGKSTVATIEHLLRHISLRIAEEGQILTDDINRLKPLCLDILKWIESRGSEFDDASASTKDSATKIKKTLNQLYREAGAYPDLLSLSKEAGELRRALTIGLEQLQEMRADYGSEDEYQTLRQRIKDYTVNQIKDEAKLIDPAYLGKGPRR